MSQPLPVPAGEPLDPSWRLSVVECLRRFPLAEAIRAMESRRAELARACPSGMLPLGDAAARLGVGAPQLAGFLGTRPELRKRCRAVDGRVYVPERLLAGVRTAVKAFRLGSAPSLGPRRRE
jgi:hypothetical protein